MARPKRYLDWKQSIYIATWGAVAPATATAAANAYLSGYHPAFTAMLGGLSVASGVLATSPFWYRSVPRKKTAMQYAVDFEGFKIITRSDGTKEARWKERPSREYVFRHRLLDCPVPESVLSRFLRIGWQRENNARRGTWYNRVESGESSHRRLRRNEAWSMQHFTQRLNDKFDVPTYNSCIRILVITVHHTGERQGTPGNLVHHNMSVSAIMADVKSWWLWLEDNAPTARPSRVRRFWPKVGLV